MQKLVKAPEEGFELPPLASQRSSEDFRAGQALLLLVDDALLNSRVESVVPVQNAHPPSPGFLRLYTPGQRRTRFLTPYTIIDMDRTSVVPQDAWQRMKKDKEYREAYLSDGGIENQRVKESFEIAIAKRMENELSLDLIEIEGADITASGPRRARPRHGALTTDIATLAAWDEDTGSGMFESEI